MFDNNGVKVLKDDCVILEGCKTENGLYVINLKTENEALSVDKESSCVTIKDIGHVSLNV
jgi:hypothetical protein